MKCKKFKINVIILLIFALMMVSCSDDHTHTWDGGLTIIEKTCENNGWIVYSCSCGAQKAVKIESTGPEYNASDICIYCGKSSGDHPSLNASRECIVDYAVSKIGCQCKLWAEGPNSFDECGLVVWCYNQIGCALPHDAELLYNYAANQIPVSIAEPGDILYRPGHVAIFIGNGNCIRAQLGRLVCCNSISHGGWTHALKW